MGGSEEQSEDGEIAEAQRMAENVDSRGSEMNNLNNMNDLYNKALSAGVFNPGYVLAGIKKLKEFREKRQRKDGITYFKKRREYDELNDLWWDVDEHMGNGYRLNSTPGASVVLHDFLDDRAKSA